MCLSDCHDFSYRKVADLSRCSVLDAGELHGDSEPQRGLRPQAVDHEDYKKAQTLKDQIADAPKSERDDALQMPADFHFISRGITPLKLGS